MEITQGIETEIRISSHEKHAAALWLYISNKNKSYPIADSEVKRKLKIFDDNEDAKKLITNLANLIKFWT